MKCEKKRISDLAFRISFSTLLMAIRDLYPEVDIDTQKVIWRMNDILNEFNTVGNRQVDMLMDVVKDEFEVNVRKL